MLPITWKAYIDWNGDDDFGDASEDASGDLLNGSISRGRGTATDDFGAGSGTIELLNTDGLYSPFNTGGSLHGSILPGRAMKIEAVHNAVTYPVWRGFVTDIRQSRTPDGRPTVVFGGVDWFDSLSRGNVRIRLQENKRVDQLMTVVLDETLVPVGDRNLDIAEQTLATWWHHQGSPLEALKSAVQQNLGGQLYVARDGKVTFDNRYARSGQVLHATVTGPQALGMEIKRTDLYDEIIHTWAGFNEDTAATPLFSLFPTGQALQPGTTAPQNTIGGEYHTGAKDVIEPAANTDYIANTAADGSGADMTFYVTVYSFTSYGGGFQVTFNNAAAAVVYLTLLQVRGMAIRKSNDERSVTRTVVAPILSGQTLKGTFEFNDDVDAVQSYADLRAEMFAVIQPRPTIMLLAGDDAMAVTILDAELGKRIRLQNTAGLYPTEIDDYFYIESISLGFRAGAATQAEWGLFHEDQAEGNFFRISAASGGGQDYSLMTGGERIGF